jgi:CRISPR-associated protein Csm4
MPQIIPCHLQFPAGFRAGSRGVNLEEAEPVLPSDTLFGALIDCARRTGRYATAFVERFKHAPPFRITSAFPRAGDVRFYPMPAGVFAQINAEERISRGKSLKRIQFVSEGVLQRLIKGEPAANLLFPASAGDKPRKGGGASLQDGALWLMLDEMERLPSPMRLPDVRLVGLRRQVVWSRVIMPRVTVSRLTQESAIFHSARIAFGAGCGLWFGASFATEAAREEMLGLLSMLQHDGLGGERSAGYGAFTFEVKPAITFHDATPNGSAFLLSRFHPLASELDDVRHPASAYALAPVAGWLRSPDGAAQRRKRVMMIEAGSVIHQREPLSGDLADVTPEFKNPAGQLPHRVYRSGLALTIGWPSQKERSAP